jgi:hypothetical protein
MYKMICVIVTAVLITIGGETESRAQPADLNAYVDANGLLDVQKLTCYELRSLYQEHAEALMS